MTDQERILYENALKLTAEELALSAEEGGSFVVRTHEHNQERKRRLKALLAEIDSHTGPVTEELILEWARRYCEAPATVRICVEARVDRALARMRREVMGYGQKARDSEHPGVSVEVGGPAKRAEGITPLSLFAP